MENIAVYAVYKIGSIGRVRTETLNLFIALIGRLEGIKESPSNLITEVKKKGLIEGSFKDTKIKGRQILDGWQLTIEGIRWILENVKNIDNTLSLPESVVDYSIPITETYKSHLFLSFSQKQDINEEQLYHFFNVLNCRSDASKDIVMSKINRNIKIATLCQNEQLLEFWDRVAEKVLA